ncbi:hypothetical protein [Haloflavibacter putidus]|uniref:Lipoprotein n=1 Tax=Haloflavibacter putidus TaxID=2576776 RepID=A0A507ZC33_9FLAO|nr:hypothetical protein [Haloflavibacter putidus]TQD33634.1 hypothetical protein FKR84_12985 [Haloflavibacter putidus]
MKNMRFLLCLLAFASFASCQTDTKKNQNQTETSQQEARNDFTETATRNTADTNSVKEENPSKLAPEPAYTGKYKRLDDGKENETTCDCNCLEINFDHPVDVCIDKNAKLQIQVAYTQTNDGKVKMYYVSGSGKTKTFKSIPWEKFDKDTPLAIIEYTKNEELELDWKGFTQNKELVVDYAIFGKKNLEGKFKRI